MGFDIIGPVGGNIVVGLFMLAGTVFSGAVAYNIARLNQRTLEMGKVAEATHALVNSNFGVQLKVNEVLARRVADLTRDPDDMAAAALASKLYRDHMDKQATVDANTANEAKKGA